MEKNEDTFYQSIISGDEPELVSMMKLLTIVRDEIENQSLDSHPAVRKFLPHLNNFLAPLDEQTIKNQQEG